MKHPSPPFLYTSDSEIFLSDTENAQINSPSSKISQAQALRSFHRGSSKKNSSQKRPESEVILIDEDDIEEREPLVSKKLKADGHSLTKKLNETDLSAKIPIPKQKEDPTYRPLADLKKNLRYFRRDANTMLSLLPRDSPPEFFASLLPFTKTSLFGKVLPSLNLDQLVAAHRQRGQAANLLQSKKSSNIIIDDDDNNKEGRSSLIEIRDDEQIEEATHAKPFKKESCSLHHNSPFCYCNPAVHVYKSFLDRIELFLKPDARATNKPLF